MFTVTDNLDLHYTEHRILFDRVIYPWEVLPHIKGYLQSCLKPANLGKVVGHPFIGEHVFIGKGTVIEEGAMIKGPAWIGENCELRKGCYLRENVLIGNNVVIGNSSEIKNALIFDSAQIPHFNYVGDSILGFRAHLGAGAILSNVRLDRKEVHLTIGATKIATGLKKMGAILGDRAEIGCNAVLSPGSLIGRDSIIYPNTSWRGLLPKESIGKSLTELQIIQRSSR